MSIWWDLITYILILWNVLLFNVMWISNRYHNRSFKLVIVTFSGYADIIMNQKAWERMKVNRLDVGPLLEDVTVLCKNPASKRILWRKPGMLRKATPSTQTSPFLSNSPLSLCSLSFYSFIMVQLLQQTEHSTDVTTLRPGPCLTMLKCRCHKFHISILF